MYTYVLSANDTTQRLLNGCVVMCGKKMIVGFLRLKIR
jgi:hypothetical protein